MSIGHNHVDLRHARTFVTVAELGTVSKAAVRLRIAQPALSRQISNLEQELGLKLFDRVGRRLVLTGEGEQLLGDCRGLLSCASAVVERAQLLRRGDTGTLKVAASPQFIEAAMSDFLHRYAQRFPSVQVKLIEAIAWSDTLGMLERGEIHVGQNLLGAVRPGDPRFASLALQVVELLAAYHAPLILGKSGAIEIARLAAYPLLVLDNSFVSRRNFNATCRLAGTEANIVFESRTPHTLLAMAERGHGVAVVPSAVRIDRYPLRIVRVTFRGKPLHEPLAVFWDKRRHMPSYATAFCAMLAEYVREVFPISRPSEPKT
ncbi:MAG: LysR family transcriptional regulator [Sterolibacteriaceae bacterium]|uniref:LysR family transcriptional regulator n=1 Tax=Candidatus Methylophosphatis roskildensis TaxID=2899263 RepID=A0A9D7HQ35_9PROT|nr:LysR family transcriptional regulator [Candidatus Methylophosphatis roskildensis]